ncbi:hypothetical protein FA95DRAFT_1038293 [Auriscalpium vulgare]|uniref:Uncharacterized protein n=1 Tax=Auriscalpium vulgare TaxID=40419 RepID=A0ACB8RY44_9AGAM|nr:hypothetical protein FA95DRAFT_1038293 [Auriscalpium vulgare]
MSAHRPHTLAHHTSSLQIPVLRGIRVMGRSFVASFCHRKAFSRVCKKRHLHSTARHMNGPGKVRTRRSCVAVSEADGWTQLPVSLLAFFVGKEPAPQCTPRTLQRMHGRPLGRTQNKMGARRTAPAITDEKDQRLETSENFRNTFCSQIFRSPSSSKTIAQTAPPGSGQRLALADLVRNRMRWGRRILDGADSVECN